ncbi:MAG: HD domain-containing protein [Clostridia bacterium]|nr:HD domain-containing protein [Clostridia bacterium]
MNGYDYLEKQVFSVFDDHGLSQIKIHTQNVIELSKEFSFQFNIHQDKLKKAALLHDISGIIKNRDRVSYCESHKIPLIEEEIELPVLAHQKISKHMAKNRFDVQEEDILSAISCHTTLKSDANPLDKALFIADKLAWDQEGIPPYFNSVSRALETSLDYGIYIYMDYVINNQWLKVIHPDFLKTYLILKRKFY